MLARLALFAYLTAALIPSLCAVNTVPSSVALAVACDASDGFHADDDPRDCDDGLADTDPDDDEEDCLPSARAAARLPDPVTPLAIAGVLFPDSVPPDQLFEPPRLSFV